MNLQLPDHPRIAAPTPDLYEGWRISASRVEEARAEDEISRRVQEGEL